MNPKVDFYFEKAEKWREEYGLLRQIALDCDLTEELKWGCPCYTWHDKNIVLIHGFKDYCGLLFFKGALLNDTHGILIQQTENVQAARQARFTRTDEIKAQESILKAHIFEAIELEKAGQKVVLKKTEEYKMPEELKARLDDDPALKTAFQALTPGRQRGYIYYFSQPKQSKTRIARIETSVPDIMNGKGIND